MRETVVFILTFTGWGLMVVALVYSIYGIRECRKINKILKKTDELLKKAGCFTHA
jgi:hypothetical protein